MFLIYALTEYYSDDQIFWAISITYSEHVSEALGTQDTMRVHHIILSSVACLAPQYSFTLSYKQHNFGGQNLLKMKCVFWFYLQIVWNISHSQKNWARYDQRCSQVLM